MILLKISEWIVFKLLLLIIKIIMIQCIFMSKSFCFIELDYKSFNYVNDINHYLVLETGYTSLLYFRLLLHFHQLFRSLWRL